MSNLAEENNCPLCKKANNCMINSAKPCWCVKKDFPAALIDLVEPELKNKACICADCAAAYNDSLEKQ